MVNYELIDLFQNRLIDKQIEIAYDGGTITNSELFAESMQLTESLCSDSELRFGTCESSVIKFKIANVVIPLFGKWITGTMYLNGNRDKPFILGKYKVVSDTPTADRKWRDIVAYDAMYDILNADVAEWHNTILPNENSTVTMRTFRTSFIHHFGLEQEDVELVNDNMIVEKTIEPSEMSGKDVITAICEINGCFGHISRDGKFKWIYLAQDIQGLYPANDLYPADDLFPRDPGTKKIGKNGSYSKCTYEDFVTQGITHLQIRKEENDIGAISPRTQTEPTEDDNCYIIQDNFLVYGKGSLELERIADNIMTKIQLVSYRPFEAEVMGNPCIEVGDAVRINTRYELIETYVLTRTLKGIQALKDSYKSNGIEKYAEKTNGVMRQIIQLKGKTNVIVRTVEENRQEMIDITEGLHSLIKQNAGQIVMKVDSTTGEMVLVELSVSPKNGSAFKVKAKNINMTAEETISFMAGGDLDLKGKKITISSDNFGVDKNGNVKCKNINAFSITGPAVEQFSKTVDDSAAMAAAYTAIAAAKKAGDDADAAAKKAQSAADGLKTTVDNLNDTIIPQINTWIKQLSDQIKELGKPGIS